MPQAKPKTPKAKQLVFKTIMNQTRAMSYTPRFKRFAKKNIGTLTRTKILINNNIEKLSKGKVIQSADGRIRISKGATGKYTGQHNIITLKVETGNKIFFTKIAYDYHGRIASSYQRAEMVLRKYGRKIGGINIKLVTPHLIYSDSPSRKTRLREKDTPQDRVMLFSEYIPKDKVVQTAHYDGKDILSVVLALESIKRTMRKEGVFLDRPEINSFYDPKAKTIYLFDL